MSRSRIDDDTLVEELVSIISETVSDAREVKDLFRELITLFTEQFEIDCEVGRGISDIYDGVLVAYKKENAIDDDDYDDEQY